jgi:hypothetical protein
MQSTNSSRLLSSNLLSLAKSTDMQDFVCKVKATAQRIKDCGGDLPDSQIMAKLISGLTSTFSNFVSSFFLLADDKRDDVDKVTKPLINQE